MSVRRFRLSPTDVIFNPVPHKGTVFKCGVSIFIRRYEFSTFILVSGLQAEGVPFFEEIELNLEFLCVTDVRQLSTLPSFRTRCQVERSAGSVSLPEMCCQFG
jgi:hypothetical protein